MAVRLPGGWWLCRDTGIPNDYPPKAREELVERRLAPKVAQLPSFPGIVVDVDRTSGFGPARWACCNTPYPGGHLGTCPYSVMRGLRWEEA